MSQDLKSKEEKIFFYYPGWNKKFPRRVIAGLLNGNQIELSEAICFPGHKPKIITVKLTDGRNSYVVDPGTRADSFNKKEGKAIAIERVRGYKEIPTKVAGVNKIVTPGKKLIGTIMVKDSRLLININSKSTTLFINDFIEIADGEEITPGKAFVIGVESYLKFAGFPEKLKKNKKDKTPVSVTN